jgi:hypothetical protein
MAVSCSAGVLIWNATSSLSTAADVYQARHHDGPAQICQISDPFVCFARCDPVVTICGNLTCLCVIALSVCDCIEFSSFVGYFFQDLGLDCLVKKVWISRWWDCVRAW